MAAAFSDEVMTQGSNSDLIEPERDQLQAVVLRVMDHRDGVGQSRWLRCAMRSSAISEESGARGAAVAAAESAAAKLRDGSDWSVVLDTIKPEEPGLVDRYAATCPPVSGHGLQAPGRPLEGGASIGTAVLDNGDAVVVRLTKVQDGEIKPADSGQIAPEASMLSQLMGRQLYTEMLRDMESRAKIERQSIRAEVDL
jgi:peptidyl-prolyl cis-trans isomerase D